MTIIDGGCARVAKNILCKIFIILAYSQYRRYKYSSCTPPGCYEICCYLFSEGTLMRPPVIAEVSPPREYAQVWLLCMPPAHRGTCTYHPTPPASSTHEVQIYIMRASYPGGVVAVITGVAEHTLGWAQRMHRQHASKVHPGGCARATYYSGMGGTYTHDLRL